MNDTFLQQLEQRTEQVKITLANLEAERVRIEGMIAQLQPIVPHYDALLAAERAIAEANIELGGGASHHAAQPPQEASQEAGGQSQPGHPGWPGDEPGAEGQTEHATPPPGEQPPQDASWQQPSEPPQEHHDW